MKTQSTLFVLIVLFLLSCSKSSEEPQPEPEPEPEEETLPKELAITRTIAYFHEDEAYYQPYVYRYDTETAAWSKRIGAHFSTISESSPTYIGYTQPYVEDSGVNLFHMVTLYAEHIGSTNVKTAGINVEKVLGFVPDESSELIGKEEDNDLTYAKGEVEVVSQKVKIRKSGLVDFFEIGISGTGTYDLKTGVIDLEVHFDEREIGGQEDVVRQYKISKEALIF
ncbi:hypothetical protein H8B06_03915 [Sphingobacterium sp. DN00404]|uniref:Uncharacterized protein n=1 Tax=Sphingobacterium micropteri TaxID=2763501 RepID=A0ABR7YKX3_9SPHI|nr:hypothetical protein [Sphingobacterium micropteri]MBD1431962.1 hypothetical protein [Sphingobacterium micropteri]